MDADCVSKLGWEYLCADITPFLNYGPHFNLESVESPSRKVEQRLIDYLQNAITEGSPKRCIYRGSGAPCRTNLSELIDGGTNQHYLMLRHMSCAPNFYCASVELSEDFNTQVVRTVNEFDYFSPNFNRPQSFEFGEEAQVLGRPLHYVNGQLTGGLPGNIQTSIVGNLQHFHSQLPASSFHSNEAGICRPARAMSSDNPTVNHRNVDNVLWRTDYISQIGGCNSSIPQADRFLSCPNFNLSSDAESMEKDVAGNYLFLNADYSETQKYLLATQNSCGSEALSLGGMSPFRYLETDPLGSINLVRLDQPALARDGCLRRAGSYCHSDLDCSPNALHAGQVEHFDLSYFGNSLAEKEYWQESLVCGQGLRQPYSTESSFQNFDMTRNRCCRPVGEKFTMYTAVDNTLLAPSYDPTNIGPLGNPRPNTKVFSYLSPNSDYRYSRYSNIQLYSSWDASYTNPVAPTLIGTAAGPPSTNAPYAEAPAVLTGEVPHKYQWKAFQDGGRNMCCGSGFVRLFSDSTNNWKKEDRVRFNTKNFQCLNYHTNLFDPWSIFITSDLISNYQRFQTESELLAVNPRKNGHIQVPFLNQEDFALVPPSPVQYNQGLGNTPLTYGKEDYRRRMIYNTAAGFKNYPGTVILDTTPWGVDGEAHAAGEYDDAFTNAYQLVNHLFPYQPLAVGNAHMPTTTSPSNFFPVRDAARYPMISFTLPIYIMANAANFSNIVAISLVYYTSYLDETSTASEIELSGGVCPAPPAGPIPPPIVGSNVGVNSWCIDSNNIIYVVPDLTATVGGNPWAIAGVRIYFTPLNNLGPLQHTYGPTIDPLNDPRAQAGMYPGNPLYILTKLERFELLGIPQIFYEPVVCNSSRGQLVPGLFKFDNMSWFDNIAGMDYPGQGNVTSELPNIFQSNYPTGNPEYYPTTDNPLSKVVLQDQVSDNLEPVFSAHEFLCCQKLGAQVTNPAQCCSGEGTVSTTSAGNVYYCSLPRGTSLNVYFNRFVSGEGYVGDYSQCIADAGLDENDFIPETGSPKLSKEVYDKLIYLGAMFCNTSNKKFPNGCPTIDYTGVRLGSAFGYFYPEPFHGWEYALMSEEPIVRDPTYLSIIDSMFDVGNTPEGFSSSHLEFQAGFRWNHHVYCDKK